MRVGDSSSRRLFPKMNALLRSSKQALQHAGRSFASSPHPDRKVALLGAAGGIGQPLGLLLKVRSNALFRWQNTSDSVDPHVCFCICRYRPTSATSHSTILPGHPESLLTSVTSTQKLCARWAVLSDPGKQGCDFVGVTCTVNLMTN